MPNDPKTTADHATAAELRDLFSMNADEMLDDTIATCAGTWVRRGDDLWLFEDETGDEE